MKVEASGLFQCGEMHKLGMTGTTFGHLFGGLATNGAFGVGCRSSFLSSVQTVYHRGLLGGASGICLLGLLEEVDHQVAVNQGIVG